MDYPMYPILFAPVEEVEEVIRVQGRKIRDTLILRKRRAAIPGPNSNKKEYHYWGCGYCAFLGTSECPNPAVEWAALKEGATPEEAFALALQDPVYIEPPEAEEAPEINFTPQPLTALLDDY